jgi:uncharacterized protein YebE (UPF0316 family)
MVKNLKILTAIFGLSEALIYIFGLAIVLSGEQSILEMVVYAVGFSLGLIAGMYVEQKLAIGYVSYTVNINHSNQALVEKLRSSGFGVTVFHGEGKMGDRIKLEILIKRKREKELLRMVEDYEPNAFMIAYEPKMFRGGYLTDLMRKRMKLRNTPTVSEQNIAADFYHKTTEEMKNEIIDLTVSIKE